MFTALIDAAERVHANKNDTKRALEHHCACSSERLTWQIVVRNMFFIKLMDCDVVTSAETATAES